MSPSSAPPLPKQPVERTFVVAVTVLGLAAVAQLIAVVVALAPELPVDQLRHAFATARPAAAQTQTPATAPVGPDAATAEKAQRLIDQADQLRNQKDFQGSLTASTEADRLIPNSPGILYRVASAQSGLGDNASAVAVLKRIVALPATNPEDAPFIQRARAALVQLGGASAVSTAPAKTAGAPAVPSADQPLRDEVGIPIGSTIGIVEAKLADSDPGYKTLRLATKASASTPLESPGQNVTIVVHFYEQNDHGDIVETDSRLASDWVSSPVDWANGDIELLNVKYHMPPTDRGDLPPLQYYGYVVGVYYKGELQDQRADPVSLLDQFPLKIDANSAQ
jgi:hypothetical protein